MYNHLPYFVCYAILSPFHPYILFTTISIQHIVYFHVALLMDTIVHTCLSLITGSFCRNEYFQIPPFPLCYLSYVDKIEKIGSLIMNIL